MLHLPPLFQRYILVPSAMAELQRGMYHLPVDAPKLAVVDAYSLWRDDHWQLMQFIGRTAEDKRCGLVIDNRRTPRVAIEAFILEPGEELPVPQPAGRALLWRRDVAELNEWLRQWTQKGCPPWPGPTDHGT